MFANSARSVGSLLVIALVSLIAFARVASAEPNTAEPDRAPANTAEPDRAPANTAEPDRAPANTAEPSGTQASGAEVEAARPTNDQPTTSRQSSGVVVSQVLRATRAVDPVVIDGRDDDAVWAGAESSAAFRERIPRYGAEAELPTSLRVAYDDDALYVLVRTQVRGGRAISRTLRRDDPSLLDDDAITIRVDPNHDGKTAFNFSVNSAGAQYDVLVLDDGDRAIDQWDGVWKGEVSVEDGWYVAEFRIPFSVLGVQRGSGHRMGFNVTRGSVATNAVYDWQLPDPPNRNNSPSTFGEIDGIKSIHTRKALEWTPFVTARTDFKNSFRLDPRNAPNLSAGFDARLQTAPGSYGEWTLLTDFSHVAVDQVQVASDRFPLFFEEQRPFFLNGLAVMDFGQKKVRQLIDTRRIGRDGDRVTPILSGLKAYGYQGKWSYAALNVQTLERLPDAGDPNDEGTPSENYSVARIRYQARDNWWLGAITGLKHRFNESGHDHVSGGLDSEVRSKDNKWNWYSWWTAAATEQPAKDEVRDDAGEVVGEAQPVTTLRGTSAYTRLRYYGQLLRPYVDWVWSDEDFDPAMGFFRRTGVAEHYAGLNVVPRLNRWGIHEIAFAGTVAETANSDYSLSLRESGQLSVIVFMQNGQQLSLVTEYVRDRVQDEFMLYGFEVPAADYAGWRRTVTLTTPTRKSMDAYFSYNNQDFFSGRLHQLVQTIRVRPSRHFLLNVTYNYLLGELAEGQDFSFGYANGQMIVALDKNLALDALGRLSLEPTNKFVGAQTRVRYHYARGSDLYLVHRMNYPLNEDDTRSPFHELTLKLSYYLQTPL